MQQRRRNRLIMGFLALGLLAGAALMAGPAQAFVSGPGPLYPEPAWDQIKGAGRFLILTNWSGAAVLDKETGLVWERTPSITTMLWIDARHHCTHDTTTGARKGWRLPSVHELASLIDPSVTPGPTLPAGHPFTTGTTGVPAAFYWSATTSAASPTTAWGVYINSGFVNSNDKAVSNQVWCVRGGMNADGY